MKRTLTVDRLRCSVNLGCTESERSHPQKVGLTLMLTVSGPSAGESSDDLSDVIDYYPICEAMQSAASSRPFATIEALGAEVVARVKNVVKMPLQLSLTVHKESPPLPFFTDGVYYTIEEELG